MMDIHANGLNSGGIMAPGITPKKQLLELLKEHLTMDIDFTDDDNMLEVTLYFDNEVVVNAYDYIDHEHEVAAMRIR
jgi:hypothetical protein